jgi:hypothetical protein
MLYLVGITLGSQAVSLALGICCLSVPAVPEAPFKERQHSTALLSLECSVPKSILYYLAPLPQVRSTVEGRHRLKVLALGPTSASVLGQGTGLTPFTVQLERELEKALPGAEVRGGAQLPSAASAEDPFF